jgi:multiple sugar transport system permease protein/raffinose/stachyose/melibiose transport system permease protein
MLNRAETATANASGNAEAGRRASALRQQRVRSWTHLAVSWLVTFAFVLPIYIALSSAFKSQEQILANPIALPAPFTLDNLIKALSRPDRLVQVGLMNSALVTGATLLVLIPLAAALSFWISLQRAAVKAVLLALFALGLMIPPQVVLLPIVTLLQQLGLANSYPGLILSNIGGGYMSFAVFVYVGFLRTVPHELIEAARVDGASDLRIWWTIVMPLLRPATATAGIFVGLWVWNDFLNPLLILGPLQGQTITTGIYQALGTYSTDYGQVFGIMFLAAAIPVAGYLLVQKQFVAGLTSGAFK